MLNFIFMLGLAVPPSASSEETHQGSLEETFVSLQALVDRYHRYDRYAEQTRVLTREEFMAARDPAGMVYRGLS